MNNLPFRARQKRPARMVRVEPDGEQLLGFVLVAVDGVALISTETKPEKNEWFRFAVCGSSISLFPTQLGKTHKVAVPRQKEKEANGIKPREASAPKILWCAPNCRARAMTREVTKAYFVLHV